MEGEEDSGYEEQEEEKEGEARRHSGDEDAMSPESRRRHHNAGQTPAPEHESPGGANKLPDQLQVGTPGPRRRHFAHVQLRDKTPQNLQAGHLM